MLVTAQPSNLSSLPTYPEVAATGYARQPVSWTAASVNSSGAYQLSNSAAILFGGTRVAATAAVLLNVTLMAAVGTLIATPDSPLLVASCFVLRKISSVSRW